jgi:hypothetical protein
MNKHSAPTRPALRSRWLAALVAALAVAAGTGAVAAVAVDQPQTYQQRLSAEGAAIDAQLSGLQSQIDQLTADRDQLLLSNQDLTSRLATLNSQLAQVTAERDALKAQLPKPSPSPSASSSSSPSPTPSSSSSAPPAAFMPVGSSLYSGGSETPQQAFDRRCTDWGTCPELVRYFYSGLPSGAWPTMGEAATVVSFKVPSVPGFAAGNDDAALSKYLAGIPSDGRPHYITVWHEPEDDVAAGRFTAAQYRAAVLHLQQLATAQAGTGKRIKVGQVLMGWTVRPQSGRNVNDYLVPGLDFIGWDIYPHLTEADIRTEYQPAADTCESQGVPKCFLTETAPHSSLNATQAQKATWVTLSTGIAAELGFDGYMYFDSTVGGDFRLTAPVAWDAIAAEIRR